MPQEGFVYTGGVRLHYLDWGGLGRPLVLLAGLGDTAQIYGGLASKLVDRFRVVMNRVYETTWPSRNPEYGEVEVPMLAIVPDGDFHPSVPLDAPDELRQAADQYWTERLRPWIRRRTEVFGQAAPTAQVLALNSPFHHVFIAKEDETVRAIEEFLDERCRT
jgi:pimeloyl-ACP methyl ester carboxylesterase